MLDGNNISTRSYACGSYQAFLPAGWLQNYFKMLPCKKCGDVHEKFDFLENTRLKTLEHLLKAF